MDATKGNSLALSTFLSYGVTDIIGYRSIEKDLKTVVNFVWCKLCAKHKDIISQSSTLKGTAKTSAMAFVIGTSSVTKYQVNILIWNQFCIVTLYSNDLIN